MLGAKRKREASASTNKAPKRHSRERRNRGSAKPHVPYNAVIVPTTAETAREWRAFVDGACLGNEQECVEQRSAGWGIHFEHTKPAWQRRGPLPPPCTNNRAELLALITLLELVIANETPVNVADGDGLCIAGDNKYVLQVAAEWLPRWSACNFIKGDGEPVLNQDLVQRLSALLDQFRALHIPLRVMWVKAHTKEPTAFAKTDEQWLLWHGNSEADRLAGEAASDVEKLKRVE